MTLWEKFIGLPRKFIEAVTNEKPNPNCSRCHGTGTYEDLGDYGRPVTCYDCQPLSGILFLILPVTACLVAVFLIIFG